MQNKYDNILSKNKYYSLYKIAISQCIAKNKYNCINNEHLLYLSAKVTAPTLFSYVWWIIKEAQNQNIKKLYFLARDGYVLYKIALNICSNCNLNIECKYLYCSRFSLRTPTYWFIGNEAYELIFNGGYQLTLKDVLCRLNIDEEKRKKIYEHSNIKIDENQYLSKSMYSNIIEILKENKILNEYIKNISKKSYETIIKYFKQEGLLNEKTIAIVDTGWTGSMQRSIRQLIEHYGVKPNIIGFYFGMYVKPKEKEDGIYKTWYFNSKSSSFLINKFNNNLFECMCKAPHPLTIGYEEKNGKFIPLFVEEPNNYKLDDDINIQLEAIETFAHYVSKNMQFNNYNYHLYHNLAMNLLQSLMYKPSKEDVLAYSNYKFCDNMIETYYSSLVYELNIEKLQSYLIINRIYNKLFKKSISTNLYPDLFWPYGSLEISNVKIKWFYRLNILLGDVIRNYIIKIK